MLLFALICVLGTTTTTTTHTTTTTAATTTDATTTSAPTTTLAITTTTEASTASTTTAAPNANTPVSCVQCGDFGNQVPCNSMELLLDTSSPCTSAGASFCMTDVIVDAASRVSTYKRCVDRTTCNSQWFLQTSDKQVCLTFDLTAPAPSTACHYCCVADSCNEGIVPDVSVQWQPS